MIHKFRQLRVIVRLDLSRTIYLAFVQSILEYGIIGWGGCGISVLRPLILMQRRIINVCLGRSARYPTELIFKEFNILNFGQLCDVCLITFVHARPGEFPVTPGHVHGTREQSGRRLREPRFNRSAAARHPAYRGPFGLPASITGLPISGLFRRRLRRYVEEGLWDLIWRRFRVFFVNDKLYIICI